MKKPASPVSSGGRRRKPDVTTMWMFMYNLFYLKKHSRVCKTLNGEGATPNHNRLSFKEKMSD